MLSSLSPRDAPLPSSIEESQPLKYQHYHTNGLANTPRSPFQEPFNGRIGDDEDDLDDGAVDQAGSSRAFNSPSPPFLDDGDDELDANEPPVVPNGHGKSQHPIDNDHGMVSVNSHVDLHAPSAIRPTLPDPQMLLGSESGSHHDAPVRGEPSLEREAAKSDGSGGELPEEDEPEDKSAAFGKLLRREPTPPRHSSGKTDAEQAPQKLPSILRPSKRHVDSFSDGTLLDSQNGSTDGTPKRTRKSVTFNDVPQLVPPIKIKSTVLPRPLLLRVDRSAKTRRSIIAIQNEVDIIRRKYNHQRFLFVEASQDMAEHCLQLTDLLKDMPIDPGIKSQITVAWNKIKSSVSGLVAQDRFLQQSDRTLETVESRALTINTDLLAREMKLFQSYDEYDIPVRHHQADHGADDASVTVSAVSASSYEHPTVASYYDKIGEVSLALDHLHNLDTEHVSNIYAVESARQRGVLVTERKFDEIYTKYFRERKELIQHYMRCRQETMVFYQLCQEQKLKAEPPNLPPEILTTLDSSLRRTAWDMTGIDATSMEGGAGEEEEVRHESEPSFQHRELDPSSKRLNRDPVKFAKEKVWSWIRHMAGFDSPEKHSDDSIAHGSWGTNTRFISGIVDSVGVQSQAPRDPVDPDDDRDIDAFSFDKFEGGRKSQRRDSDPVLDGDAIALRLALREEKRRPRSSSVPAFVGTAVEGFQKATAVKNVVLYLAPDHAVPGAALGESMAAFDSIFEDIGPDPSLIDPNGTPTPPPPPPHPEALPQPPQDRPPMPSDPQSHGTPEDSGAKAPPPVPTVVPPPLPPLPPGYRKGSPSATVPEQVPVKAPPLPPLPPGYREGPSSAIAPEKVPIMPPPVPPVPPRFLEGVRAKPTEHPPAMTPARPAGAPDDPRVMPPEHPPVMPPQHPPVMPPPPRPAGLSDGPPKGPPPPPPPPYPPPGFAEGPPTMPQGTHPGPPPPLMRPPPLPPRASASGSPPTVPPVSPRGTPPGSSSAALHSTSLPPPSIPVGRPHAPPAPLPGPASDASQEQPTSSSRFSPQSEDQPAVDESSAANDAA